jgi:hypothetical protein
MKIHQFSDDGVLMEKFIRFGMDHYRDDNNWIAPFNASLREQLSATYGFRLKPGNDAMHFLAVSGGHAVGRISAMVNKDLRVDDVAIGTVGFFECIDDHDVARGLFDAARDWLRDKHGIRRVWGPMNFDIWHEYRLMTRGFDRKVFHGEPYNKSFYPDLFTEHGWEAVRTWESVELVGARDLQQVIGWGSARYEKFLDNGYRFEPFDESRFDRELEKLYHALTASFGGFVGFTPISIDEFAAMFSKLRHALVPEWFTFIYTPQDELAGFAGAFLDLSDAVRSMHGSTGLLSRLRFVLHRRRTDRVVFYIVGVSPEETARVSGLGGAAVRHVSGIFYEQGIRSVVAALMPRDGRSRGLVGGDRGLEAEREYTLYELES